MFKMPKNPPKELPLLTIENLEFVYRRNFEGRAETYNDEGNRYFNAKIPNEAMARQLEADGWNVKATKPGKNHPNPAEHVVEYYIEVTVGYKFRPPTITLIRDNRPTPVTESTVSMIDSIEFENIDVVVRAVLWNDRATGEPRGYKAWLKSMYGTVVMDDLDRKYANLGAPLADPTQTEYDE